jgi:hypothetical protein
MRIYGAIVILIYALAELFAVAYHRWFDFYYLKFFSTAFYPLLIGYLVYQFIQINRLMSKYHKYEFEKTRK